MKAGVYNMDCMEAMKSFPDGYFDLGVIDPPYGLELALNGQFAKYGGSSKWDVVPEKVFFEELFRVTKNQIIWGWNYFSHLTPPCKGFIYWNKMNHHENRADGEIAYTSYNKLARHFEYMWDGNRYGTVGNIQGVGKKSIRIHPTQKPVALYEWIYMNYLPQGGKVLDTHLGSGSNRIAADKQGNIEFYGFEIDKEYFDASVKRFDQYKAQLTMF